MIGLIIVLKNKKTHPGPKRSKKMEEEVGANLQEAAKNFLDYISWNEEEGVVLHKPIPNPYAAILHHVNKKIETLDDIGGRLLVDGLKQVANSEYSDPESAAQDIADHYTADQEFKQKFKKDLIENDRGFMDRYTAPNQQTDKRVSHCLNLKMHGILESVCTHLQHNIKTNLQERKNNEQ